jgi:ABC-type multidrug transport system ATPase subunit
VTAVLLACDRPRFVGSELELGQFEAPGPLLVLVGGWHPLFELLTGQRRLGGGSLRVAGADAEGAAVSGKVGVLLAGAPLPPAWTLREVLCQSARLLGHSRRLAAEQAADIARDLGLEELSRKKLARLTPGEQRAAGIAVAAMGEPAALALEDPFGDLEPSAQAYVVRVLERALRGRPALISMAEVPGSAEQDGFARSSDELLFVAERGLVARGSHAELIGAATSYRVVVLREADALLSRLTEAGYEARRVMAAEVTALVVVDRRGQGTGPLLRSALEANAPIIELVPLNLRPSGPLHGDSAQLAK